MKSLKYDRAKEILNEEQNIEVLLNNMPVWINNINPRENSAQVIDHQNNSQVVSVDELVEGDLR